MFFYTISEQADIPVFEAACKRLESLYPDMTFTKRLEDTDGSLMQTYRLSGRAVTILIDYNMYAVYIESQVELKSSPWKRMQRFFRM